MVVGTPVKWMVMVEVVRHGEHDCGGSSAPHGWRSDVHRLYTPANDLWDVGYRAADSVRNWQPGMSRFVLEGYLSPPGQVTCSL